MAQKADIRKIGIEATTELIDVLRQRLRTGIYEIFPLEFDALAFEIEAEKQDRTVRMEAHHGNA